MINKFFIIMFAMILFYSENLFATEYGSQSNLAKMENTLLKLIVVYNDSSEVTVHDDPTGATLNIGGASPGTVVGNFIAGVYFPAGTSTHFKPTFSGNMTFKGAVYRSDNGLYYYTSNNPTVSNYRTSTVAYNGSNWDFYTDVTLNLGFNLTSTDVANINFPENGTVTIRFSFDMSNALRLSDISGTLRLQPSAPNKTITQVE